MQPLLCYFDEKRLLIIKKLNKLNNAILLT